MNYYLKNFNKDTVQLLGDSDNMDEVVRTLVNLIRKASDVPQRSDQGVMNELFGDYNQTGKDTIFTTMVTSYGLINGRPIIPICSFVYRPRTWLVLDEKGRHIPLNEVKSWVANYKSPKPSGRYLGLPPDYVQGRRWKWPSLIAGANRQLDDPDLKAEVEEMAGAHTANKLFPHTKQGWNGLYWDMLEDKAYRRRPVKSWKTKKCSRQWQRDKKCGKKPGKPVYDDELELDSLPA